MTGSRSSRLTLTVALTTRTGVSSGSKKEREKKLAHAGLRGDGGERGACNGDAEAAEEEDEEEVVKLREDGNVVENGEERKHENFGEEEEERVGDELGEEDGERIADGEAEGAERVIGLLAEEARLQHQGSGEKNGEPEEAGTEFAGLFGGGVDGKAEEDENDEDEDDGGGEEFAGTELGAQFLAEEGGGVGEEAHGEVQAPPKVRMEWREAPRVWCQRRWSRRRVERHAWRGRRFRIRREGS